MGQVMRPMAWNFFEGRRDNQRGGQPLDGANEAADMNEIAAIALTLILAVAGGFAVYRYVPIPRDVTAKSGERYQGTMKKGLYHGRGF